MADFQVLGEKVKKARAAGFSDAEINSQLAKFNTDLSTLDASGFGPDSTRAKAPSSKLESFGQGAAQGASFGFGDEVAAAAAATFGTPEGYFQPQGENWTDRYASARDKIRGELKYVKESNPKTYTAGEITGAVAPAMIAPQMYGSTYIGSAPTMASAIGRSSGVGAIGGGLNAFGNAEGTPQQQALQTAAGTAGGAIVGAAVPPVVAGVQKGGQWVYNQARSIPSVFGVGTREIAEEAPVAAQSISTQLPPPQVPQAAPVAPQTPLTPRAIDAAESVRPPVTMQVNPAQDSAAIQRIAKTLTDAGYTADQAREIIRIRGPEAMLADIGEPMTRLARTQKSAPGAAVNIATTALENRQLGQQGRLEQIAQKALGTKAGLYESDDALVSRLEQEAAPLYQQAFENAKPVDLSPVMTSIDQQLAKMPAKSPIRAAIMRAREMLGETVDEKIGFKPYADLEMLHNAKMAIDDMLDAATKDNSLGRTSKRAVLAVKNQLLDAMDQDNPAYKQGREIFSGVMTSREALQAGRQFLKEDAESLAGTMADLAIEDQKLFRAGALRALVDIIDNRPPDVSVVQQLRKTGLTKKLAELIPNAEDYKAFVQQLANERTFANTRATVLGGSQTTEKLLDAMDQAGSIGGLVSDVATGDVRGVGARALDWLKQSLGPGEKVRADIAKRLLSNDPELIDETLRRVQLAQRLQALPNQISGPGAVGAATAATPAATATADRLFGRQP